MPSYDLLVAAIRERINYETLYGEFVQLTGRGNERNAFCIFHENTNTPALGINIENGRFICRNPDCGEAGDEFAFYMRVRSLTFREAVDELARRVGLDPAHFSSPVAGDASGGVGCGAFSSDEVDERQEALLTDYAAPTQTPAQERAIDEDVVDAMHLRLLNTPAWLEYLRDRRGISLETVRQFKLGHDGQRYYIPVRNAEGECVNIRRYKPDATRAQDKMISWRPGFGSARLFPVDQIGEGTIYLFEGEMDCLLARQWGLNAITATGGAGTWRGVEWNPLFEGRAVVICYDADEAGRVGSAQVAVQLAEIAQSVKVVHIPLAEPVGADFTDFIVGHGHSIADFVRLAETAHSFRPDDAEGIPAPTVEPAHLHLSHASQAEYHNKPIRVAVMVSGKTTAPYIVPEEVRAFCPAAVRGTMPMCERCPVAAAGGPIERKLEFTGNDVLQFVNVPEGTLQKSVKAKVGIPAKCGYARYEVEQAINVEEVQLIPEIERTEQEAPYVTRAAFFMGHGLQANRSYIMTGETVAEPKRQLATHLIHTAVQSQSNIDAFRLTQDVVERLRVFQPPANDIQSLWSKLGSVYDDLEKHTRIFQRRDLMLAVDMVFHSVLQFRFQGDLQKRGWTEALIIGDSRTGKTSIVQRMLEYYGAGEFSTGENTTLAGLIGGLHQIGTSWALQWGRIPLNDRRLMVIDEAGNLPIDQIARLSSMRSSGEAEVIKIHTEKTNARTRQIWISNPRSPRPLSSFSQGVLAVKELIGAPEDIARFDMVVSAASGDVPLAVVNAAREAEPIDSFTRDLCHQRVMWVWSRKSDQVVWADGATDKVLELATQQGERYRYATEIPLVEPNEQRIKLARLSVATAGIFFSASEDGEKVIVLPEHVEFASAFVESLYAKPSLAFAEYSDQQTARYTLSDERGIGELMQRNNGAVEAFLEQENFTQRDLQEILSFNDRDEFRAAVTRMRNTGFLRRQGSSYYVKTPAAIRWLREHMIHSGNGNGRAPTVTVEQWMAPDLPAIPSF